MKKEKPTTEELFATIPPLPETIVEDCKKYVNTPPIYYQRKGRHAECTCGVCGKSFNVWYHYDMPGMEFMQTQDIPYRNEQAKCPLCGTEGEYEWKRCTNPKMQYFTVILIQKRTDGNLIERYMVCTNTYQQGYSQRFTCREEKRILYNLGDYYTYYYGTYYDHWCQGWGFQTYEDFIYPGWREEIKSSNFKYFEKGPYGLTQELKAYANNPGLEMFRKAGLKQITSELVYKEGKEKRINRRGKTMKAQLRLKDKQRINYLIEHDGDLVMLEVLQIEEKKKIRMTDEQRKFVYNELRGWRAGKRINYMLKFMSLQKLMNRVKKYQDTEEYKTYEGTIQHYYDYLKMREELGYDMTNEVFIYPKHLKEKHDELAEEKNRRADEVQMEKDDKEYPKIRENFGKLMKKFGWEHEGMLIRPAKTASEITMEGRLQHHCVGRMGYKGKHNNGTSYILLLRKAETPDTPYYTIEINGKGTEILQWYGAHDQKPDREIIGQWLNEYIKHLGGNQTVWKAA